MNASLVYREALERTPNKMAIAVDSETLSYRELDDMANKVAVFLKSLGVEKGDKVGFFMENNLFITYGYIGCLKIGAVVVPASYYTAEGELAHEANEGEVSVYFVSKSRLETLKKAAENMKYLKHIVLVDGDEDGVIGWGKVLSEIEGEAKIIDVDPDEPALILFTSGSTGKTKGVTHTAKSLLGNGRARTKTLRHTPDDVMITTSFLCHGAAPLIVLFPMLYACGCAVFMSHYDKEKFVEMVKEYGVTHAAASPKQWDEILELDKGSSLRNLKYATTGGDVVDIELRRRFRKLVGIPLVSSLGMTECGGYMTIPPHKKAKDESVGMPIEGVRVRLVDNNYNDVRQGETGEILVKGDTVFCCYYNDEELTRNSFIDGWFKTGDLARKDEEGYYYFEGRKKRIIVKGGGNINPLEVEDVLRKHPKVRECLVVGVKDDEVGEEVFAFVVARDISSPPDESELKGFLKGRVADRKIPAKIEIMESLPRRDKIDLKALKKLAEEIYSAGRKR